MTDWLEIPPEDPELRRRVLARDGAKLAELNASARELYLIGCEWSAAHGTRGHIPEYIVGRMTAVAEARCRARGEITG